MNEGIERVRDVLRKAALDGIPQTAGLFRQGEAYCAVGLLLREIALLANRPFLPDGVAVCQHFGIRYMVLGALIMANDGKRYDFLTIANKLQDDGTVE